jgi:uncharacterized membrane protein (DUF485 family)
VTIALINFVTLQHARKEDAAVLRNRRDGRLNLLQCGTKSHRERAFLHVISTPVVSPTRSSFGARQTESDIAPSPLRRARICSWLRRRCTRRTLETPDQKRGEIFMEADAESIEAAHASIRALIVEKLKYLVPMTIIFMVGYIGLTVLAAFAKSIMGIKVTGAFNVGYLLIAINYLLSWVLAIVYVRIANNVFDPLAAKAAVDITGAGALR